MAGKPDPLPTLIASGGAQPGYQERTDVNVRTQVVIQVLQMAGIALLAVPGLSYGLWLLGRSLVWLVSQAAAKWERLWMAAAVGAVWIGLHALARVLARRVEMGAGWRLLVELVGATALVLLCLSLVEALAEEWGWREGLRLVGGLGLVIAGPLLLWRFSWELYNPAWPESPMVRLWREWLLRQEPEAVRVVTPYPVRVNGSLHRAETPAPAADEEPEGAGPVEVLSNEFVDMVWMLGEALTRGLSRSALVTTPARLVCPSGQRLTVPYLTRLLAMAAEPWQVIELHGKGETPTWLGSDETVAAAMRMLRALVGEFHGAR